MDDPPSLLAFPSSEASSVVDLSWGEIGIALLWVIALLGINAFFVAVEFSLVSTRHSRMVQLAAEGNQQAEQVKRAQEHLERALSLTQLGITLASIGLGWIAATRVAPMVLQLLRWLPWPWGAEARDWLAVGTAFSVITYLQIVWGELVPKTLAIVYAEPIALKLAWLNTLVDRLLSVFVEIPRLSSRLVLRLLQVPLPDPSSLYTTLTAEELQVLIASVDSGGIEAEERELLANVFEFGETVASEVMVPRTSIDAVPVTATVRDLLMEVAESDHSRYPVYGESLDDIKGVVNIKELVSGLAQGLLDMDSSIKELLRPTHFEHENKLIAELLPEMQQHHRAIVVVVDEFGGTAGLITLKDIVEEIVGNLSDGPEEGDDEEPDIQMVDESTAILQAQLNLEEVNERLGLDLPFHDDYQTVGGFLIYQMQKIPKIGEKLVYGNREYQVVKMEGPRLDRVKVTTLPPEVPRSEPVTANGSLPSARF